MTTRVQKASEYRNMDFHFINLAATTELFYNHNDKVPERVNYVQTIVTLAMLFMEICY
jgi:hypothetical protein